MSEIKQVIKPKHSFPLVPILVFFGVLAITAGLFFYNNTLRSEIEETRMSIIKHEAEINKLKENKKVQVAQLLRNNKKVIETLEAKSHVSMYIDHLEDIGGALVDFNGFNMQNGVIATEVTVKSLQGKDAYKNVEKFIQKYRQEEVQDELFGLNFINSFEGNDAITFHAEFTIKDPVIKTQTKQKKSNTPQAETVETPKTPQKNKQTEQQ